MGSIISAEADALAHIGTINHFEELMSPDTTDEARFTPGYLLLLIVSIPAASYIYYLVGTRVFASPLSKMEYLVFSSLLAVVITGAYQLFFWVQRNNHRFKTRMMKIRIDDFIPFWPRWIWIYSFLYYVMIGGVVASIKSLEEGVYLIFGGLVLLLMQVTLFYFFPATTPPDYRQFEVNTISTRYLKFVQGVDNGRNCMPSMHCSVAMYIALILYPTLGIGSIIFLVLISVSCLLVKQHMIMDIAPGLLLGWVAFQMVGIY